MAEETATKVVQENSSEILCKFKNLDEKYETLRKVSSRAVVEYEDLRLNCQENFQKLKAERSKYLQVKEDLERLKQVSCLALDEYENLHRKYEVEQDCRNNAEKYATKVVNQNKELRRKSQMIIAQFGDLQTFQFPEDLLNGNLDEPVTEQQDDLSPSKEVIHNQINELKVSVEDLKKELKDAKDELAAKNDELIFLKQKYEAANRKLSANEKQYKQLNRVSMLALEEYNDLQQKYELETQCRTEAEKFAAEVLKEKKIIARKSDIIADTVKTDSKLSTALKEIEELTNNLETEKARVKELNQQLESAKGHDYTRVVEQTLTVTQEQVELLENRVKDAEKRAEEAEKKVAELEKELIKGKDETSMEPQSPVVPPPPAPPPPPPPNQLLKKFMRIVGSSKKPKKAAAQAKDPRAEAMNDMMERIKSGKVHLKSAKASIDTEHQETAPGITELGSILKSMNRSQSGSVGPLPDSKVEESGSAWSSVKLKKREPSRTISSTSDSPKTGELEKVVLRKPRSRSAGDVLDETAKDTATAELKKILQKKRAAAEPGEAETLNEAMGHSNNEDNSSHSQEAMDSPKHEEHPTSSLDDSAPGIPTENIADTGESNSTCESAVDS